MPSVVTVARQNHASSAAIPPEDAMNSTAATTNGGKPFRRNDDNSSPHSHSPLPSPHAVVATRTPENETDFMTGRRLEKKKKKKYKKSRYEEQERPNFAARSVISAGNGRESSKYDPHMLVKGSTPRGGVGGDGKWKSDGTTMRVAKEVSGRRESPSFHERKAEDHKFRGKKFVSENAAAVRKEREDRGDDSGRTREGNKEVRGIHPVPEKSAWSGWMTNATRSVPPRHNEVKVVTGMMMEEQHEKDKQGRKDSVRRDVAEGRRDKKRADGDGGEREVAGGRVGDGTEEDKRANACDAYRNGDSKQRKNNHRSSREQSGLSNGVREAGLDTSRILGDSRRSPLKSEVYSHLDIPRNHIRGPGADKSSLISSDGGGRVRSSLEVREDSRRAEQGGKLCSRTPSEKRKKAASKHSSGKRNNGSPRRSKTAIEGVEGVSPKRARNRETEAEVGSSLSKCLFGAPDGGSGSGEGNRDAKGSCDDGADTDITGAATDAELDHGDAMSVSSLSSSRPRKESIKKRRSLAKTGGGGGGGSGGSSTRGNASFARDETLLTYIAHERPAKGDEDFETGYFPSRREALSPVGAAGGVGGVGGCGGVPNSSKRYKRPRPQPPQVRQGGSARAVVWGEPCAICRGKSLTKAEMCEETHRAESTTRSRDKEASITPSSIGAGVVGEAEGPARPGQYVFLRTAASEEVQRSLMSEGEFATPRHDGLSGNALAGERIRVWRSVNSFASSKSGGAGGGGGVGGTFAEADVVQHNATSGQYRVRFVEDGAVEDVRLMKPAEMHQDDRSGGQECSDGDSDVPWLQARMRPRNRDTVRRNEAGLCEGPGGEVRGLVGDEHDPPTQRRENWRWMMRRWRWECGDRDGYAAGGGGCHPEGDGGGAEEGKAKDDRSFEERSGIPPAGDGMFPPIGKVLAVERRLLSTGETVTETGAGSVSGGNEMAGDGLEADVFLKVARLWYPQDTRSGMDPFIHGKAEVFEACRVVQEVGEKSGGVGRDARARNREATAGTVGGHIPRGAQVSAKTPAIVPCGRLDDRQPVECDQLLEPVISWVRACEARRLASVHHCLSARLNRCSGKVVNDPYQPQAEFFLSHRYCLELDAYFPLESASPLPSVVPSLGSAFERPGPSSPRLGSADDVARGNHSPRSAKARLLNRSVSDGACYLPHKKWHPLKKRMSYDHSPGGEGGGSRSCSPVIGWDSALARSMRQDSGSSTGSVGPTGAADSVSSSSVTNRAASPSLLLSAGPAHHCARELYLCHRCRHVLPLSSLLQCAGSGCGYYFCSPCAVEWSRENGSPSGKGSWRCLARWPGDETRAKTGGVVGGGGATECRERETVNGDGGESISNRPRPWMGPCCQGRCECLECTTGAEKGLLAGWYARNGLPSLYMTTLSTNTRKPKPTPRISAQVAPLLPSTPDNVGMKVQWSGWQGRTQPAKMSKLPAAPGAVTRDVFGAVNGKLPTSGIIAAPAAVRAAPPGPVFDVAEQDEDCALDDDGVAEETRVEWCSSCSAPGPTDSLTRCYYCRGGVHAVGCRQFEDMLSRKRLTEFGVGPTGQLAAAPSGEGAVGHGVAVCVDGSWRAGLVLGWSPVLRAHYVRYVEGVLEQSKTTAEGLDAMPWDGEWVRLPSVSERGVTGVHIRDSGDEQRQKQRFPHVAAQASDARWPLVDVVLRLFPPPVRPSAPTAGGSSSVPASSRPSPPAQNSSTSGPTPSAAKPAVKLLKGVLKQTWLASLASMKGDSDDVQGRIPGGDDGTQKKYRPPSVAIPARLGDQEHAASSSTTASVGNSGGEQQPWVCRSCIEAKLQRLQRRVRAHFHVPRCDAPRAAEVADPPLPSPTPTAAAVTNANDERRLADDDVRRSRRDHRLRWLPTGKPGSSRPFAFEAGFVSDLSEAHRNGAPTAAGGRTGSGVARAGKKRPRPPPVARAFAHVMAGLDSQRPIAFALPPEISGLDGDITTFFANEGSGGGGGGRGGGGEGGGSGGGPGAGLRPGPGPNGAAKGGCVERGAFHDDDVDAGFRSVVIVNGTATVTTPGLSIGAPLPSSAGTTAMPGSGSAARGGLPLEAGGVGAGIIGVDSVAFRVPVEFTSVKEVDLESSARMRPLDSSKHLLGLRRSSSGAGGVRNASHPHGMSGDVAAVAMSEDGGGGEGAGARADGKTTLKDVSKKDRLQRMDQRRMRRQGQELVDAGLLNLDVLQSRRKKLRFGRSSVHAWGVFADEPIAAGDLVIEYRGEIIGNAVADKREKMYHDMQIGSDYMFRVDEDTVVDATFKGSLARFINHSCDPSCTTRIIAVEGSKKIVIYAERDVAMGEELSYDYKFPLEPDEDARVPCRCGSTKCRGFIN